MTSFGPPSQKQLIFLYSDGHYNVITSLPGFFGTSYFCARCLKPYDNQGHHACDNDPDHCSACLQTGCPDYTKARCQSLAAMQTCDLCRFMFYGTACFTNHVSKTEWEDRGSPATEVDETRGEKIRYFDFMSLYLRVNKNGKYPLGHPEIIS